MPLAACADRSRKMASRFARAMDERTRDEPPMKLACKIAGVQKVVPYALRHTAIVRCIAAGLPLRLIAALHDTSTAMIERHYSR